MKENSPASLQYGRGRMVGYGEEAQDTLRWKKNKTLDDIDQEWHKSSFFMYVIPRRGDRSNAAKMKASNASQVETIWEVHILWNI